jgi:hypothetical protein
MCFVLEVFSYALLFCIIHQFFVDLIASYFFILLFYLFYLQDKLWAHLCHRYMIPPINKTEPSSLRGLYSWAAKDFKLVLNVFPPNNKTTL